MKLVRTYARRFIATGLIAVMYVSLVGFGGFLVGQDAHAAVMTSISDTLSVSVPSSASDHTIQFTSTTGVAIGESIRVTFPAGFVATGVTTGDVTCSGTTNGNCMGTASVSASVVEIAVGTGAVAAGDVVDLVIGGANKVTNPTATTGAEIVLDTRTVADAVIDTGSTYVAIQPQVTLRAEVSDVFAFVVDACDTAQSCSIGSHAVDNDSTATLADFDTLVAGTPETMGSSLSVTSNALNGFVVTVEQNHNMLASNGADIDSFDDGVPTLGATWNSPAGTAGSELTYGHLGIHSEDYTDDGNLDWTGTVAPTDGTDGDWAGFTGTTPITIWDNSSTGDGNTQGTGHIDVGYRIEISTLQESGVYTNQLMYIATPTY